MLADNIFSGPITATVENFERQAAGARVLLAHVRETEHLRHLGVPRIVDGRIAEIVEKPDDPPGTHAVTGVYCYDADVFDVVVPPRAVGARRARDHRRQQPLRARGNARVRRLRRVLGRRRRVDRRVLRGDRTRAPAALRLRTARGPSRSSGTRTRAAGSTEIARTSALPKPIRQTNVSFSRKGTIRGLHYHERGQDDLFVCLQGRARVVALDRDTGETFCEDIGDDNFAAVYVPGNLAHGFEALTDVLMLYHVSEEYDAERSRRARAAVGRPARRSTSGARHRRSCRNGTRPDPDHRRRRPAGPRAAGDLRGRRRRRAHARRLGRVAAVAASSTSARARAPRGCVDRRRRCGGRPAGGGRRQRGRHAARRGARRAARLLLVRLRVRRPQERGPYVESDPPNPLSAYGRTKLYGEGAAGENAWIVRSSGLFGRTGSNFVRTMVQLGREREEVVGRRRPAHGADVRRPPRRGDAGAARASHRASGISPPRATARGPSSPRRSSRRPGSARACAGSRARSSADRRRAPPIRCCAARRTPPASRTGARGYAPVSTGWGSSASSGSRPSCRAARAVEGERRRQHERTRTRARPAAKALPIAPTTGPARRLPDRVRLVRHRVHRCADARVRDAAVEPRRIDRIDERAGERRAARAWRRPARTTLRGRSRDPRRSRAC